MMYNESYMHVSFHIHMPSFPLQKWQCLEDKDYITFFALPQTSSPEPYTCQVPPKYLSINLLINSVNFPQFYLRGFANRNGPDVVYSKKRARSSLLLSQAQVARSNIFSYGQSCYNRVLQKNIEK